MTFSPIQSTSYLEYYPLPPLPDADGDSSLFPNIEPPLPFAFSIASPSPNQSEGAISTRAVVAPDHSIPPWIRQDPIALADPERDEATVEVDNTAHAAVVAAGSMADDTSSTSSAGQDSSPKLSRRPRIRRQNHSCDPCRLAKRACDLPPTVEIQGNRPPVPCTMCSLRSADCTVVWLASRKHGRTPTPRRKGPGPLSRPQRQNENENNPAHRQRKSDDLARRARGSLNPSAEWQQARRVIAQERCAQQLNLYLDVVDIPVADCLSQKCMPPCYALGIAALIPLSHATDVSSYFDRAQSTIRSCWPIIGASSATLSTEPRLFLAVSLLDALFQHHLVLRNDAGVSSRDRAIADAFRWVAIATAAQFTGDDTDPAQPGQSSSRTKDFAIATWQKGREVLFQNIGATGSFRLALSLLLFGAILPPQGLEQSAAYAEDVAFAHREGARRLQELCAKGRVHLQTDHRRIPNASRSPSLHPDRQPVDQLPPEVKHNILELLGSIEWLFWMSHSATIAMRPHPGAAPYVDHGYASVKQFGLRGPADAITSIGEHTIEDSIIARAQSRQHTVTTLWCQDVSDDLVDLAVNHAGSIVVLLWRSLALLILVSQDLLAGVAEYADFEQHYAALTTLIGSWRSTFGRITPATISRLDQLPARVRRCVLFCATDGDLAILLFDKLVRQMQDHLEDQASVAAHARLCATLSSATAYCHEQRLISATHISYLASTNLGVSSPGFQGGRGLKANVQDIGAHPQPALVVKAYALAAETFADEIQELMPRLDTRAILEMTNGLNCCLQGLQALEKTLVMFPDPENLGSLHTALPVRHNAK
ncbi:hypothetical protein BDV59DRAFT_204816 [Aspergillus ambiguus]|uniref:Zn(II)2Cys6 transcription factor domain-containing protein n=1 Tax=Aspergillus ambiguus TaxID=176160 RepID=UPI003CCE204B